MEIELERVTSDTIEEGMFAVCFKHPGELHIGRIHAIQRDSVTLEFDLLYADDHMFAENIIWSEYFYWHEVPSEPSVLVFKWPDEDMKEVMRLDFDKNEKRANIQSVHFSLPLFYENI